MKTQPNTTTRTRRTVSLVLAFIGTMFLFAATAQANNFTVTNTNDSGAGSLRQAIGDANSNPGADTISFNIVGAGVQTINLTASLPDITDPLTIDGYTQPNASANTLAVGSNATLLIELNGANANASSGLSITGGGSTIKGLVINRFNNYGILLNVLGGNTIAGNYIGTNASGTAAFTKPNNGNGIYVLSSNNVIGGTTPADRNLLSGNWNQSLGIGMGISGSNATANKVIGNYIGTDASGTANIPNINTGIVLADTKLNIIGGTTAAERNVISGNNSYQINIAGTSANNQVMGNFIGTKADGVSQASMYGSTGIGFATTASNNIIGGTQAGAGNRIAFNNVGVYVGPKNLNNAILGNSIYGSNQLGIELISGGVAGVTPNDNNAGDADTGSNNLQNYPVLTSVIASNGTTTITGTLDSAFSTTFRVEVFSNQQADSSGFGEGEKFLGFTNVTTDATGKASFTFNVPTAAVIGGFFSATATDPNNNTSEFAASISGAINNPGTLQLSTNQITQLENSGSFKIDVTRTNGSTGTVTVQYATKDGSAKAPADYTQTSGTLTFLDGETLKTITIPVVDDATPEGSEFFALNLSNPTNGATLGGITQTNLAIQDNEKPTLSISDVSVQEGDAGTTSATFTVTLSDPISSDVLFDYATGTGGTATSGIDYQPMSGHVTISPSQTSKTITVPVNGDTTQEPDETFTVQLKNPEGATISKAQGTGTIINDDAAPAPALAFSQSSYNVQENLTAISIAVSRSGDTSGAASVDYTTADGIATQKGDYEFATGTLTFAPGDASKTFRVLINQDSYVEGTETVNLVLSNATGASLGGQSTATLNILDDAVEQVTNPNDEAQFFVHQQYHDFLNREPDAGGLLYWTGQITNCGNDQPCLNRKRRDVSAAFFIEQEFQETGFFVYRLQKASFGTQPGYQQFMTDRGSVQDGANLAASKQAFANAWVQRPGFIQTYPAAMTANEFVNKLYDTAGLQPFAQERQQQMDAMMNGKTRAEVLQDVIESQEFKMQEYNPSFVLMQYFGYLRRNPDQGGYQFWLGVLNTKLPSDASGYHAMVCAFISSPEYQDRFSAIHTHNDAECAP
jgi:hypothetical protein